MNVNNMISENNGLAPQGDVERQAVASLRGYAYQVTAAALAWLDIQEKSRIFLEVAEDYAVVAKDVITAVQVKDTQASTKITLNTESVRAAILNFVTLVADNQAADVHLRYFTTSDIGTEKALEDQPKGMPGLFYWRKAAKGGDVQPLRKILDSDKFPKIVREFVNCRDDNKLRHDLLQKIHWDCGKPDIESLRKELHDRMIVICRDDFRIPTQDSPQIADLLIYHVLQRSIVKTPNDRVLTRADLLSIIDKASRVSVPRASFDILAQLIPQISGLSNPNLPVAFDLPAWLVKGSDLPLNRQMISRLEIENGIDRRLRDFGICFLVGASGVGKSSVSRSAVEKLTKNYLIVDFRNADVDEIRRRLSTLVAQLGGLHVQVVILEDLNYFNDPALKNLIAHVITVLDRRDIPVIVTSYLAPATKILSYINSKLTAIIDCPYFSEEETYNLVKIHGGDPDVWGRLAYVSGAFGHPQLVSAFIAGMSIREWPRSEILSIIKTGLSTGDVNAEREAARRSLVLALPDEARNLLYRLSLSIGNFNRDAALHISAVSPPIVQAGEALDALIGSWVEKIGKDSYRISPLAASSGQEMIPPDLRIGIHSAIAVQFLSRKSINVNEIEKIFLHALLGKNEAVIYLVAIKILTSDEQLISYLAENTSLLSMFDFSKPIDQENSEVSLLLRLVQFKILSTTEDSDRIADCIQALRRESKSEVEKTPPRFYLIVLSTLLNTIGIANYLDDWIELLLQFQKVIIESQFSTESLPSNQLNYDINENVAGILFAVGSINLASIARLQKVLEQMDLLNPDQRNLLLHHTKEANSDFSVLINNPWVSERDKALDATDSAERYWQMAKMTQKWQIRPITIQCWIARAIMLEKYAKDHLGAIKALDDAERENGADILILKARAKIYFHAKNYQRALQILRGIADTVDNDNEVERAFTLREAAISAGICNEWLLAEKWFLESKECAAQIDLPNMKVMSVGLGADAAVASFNIGQIEKSLRGLANTLIELDKIKPESSLQANNCHHIVRHTVLWIKSSIDGNWDTLPNGDPIVMKPGICSNPDPKVDMMKRPLAHMDQIWYLLANCELKSKTNADISNELHKQLVDGPIVLLEIGFRIERLLYNIETVNCDGFADHLLSYIEARVFKSKLNEQESFDMYDLSNPKRQIIPTISQEDFKQSLNQYADDAMLTFAIACACRHRSEDFLDLGSKLDPYFGQDIISESIFARAKLNTQQSASTSLSHLVIDFAMKFKRNIHVTPLDYCLSGVYFFMYAQQSDFKSLLMPMIALWQRNAWRRIVSVESFQLYLPLRTVPAIRSALTILSNNEHFLCNLLLAVVDSTKVSLPSHIRKSFEGISNSF